MTTKPIVVLGAGGLGREVMWLIDAVNDDRHLFETLGYLDEDSSKHGKTLCGRPVLGGLDWLDSCGHKEICAAVGVGTPALKLRFAARAKSAGAEFPTVIHPTVQMSRFVELAEGVLIGAGSTLTVDIRVGAYTFINLDCTVGHDAIIGECCQLNPSVNVSGGVVMGAGCEIGTGAIMIPNVQLGEGSVVGAQACVVRDIPANSTAVGVPAKVIKQGEDWRGRA